MEVPCNGSLEDPMCAAIGVRKISDEKAEPSTYHFLRETWGEQFLVQAIDLTHTSLTSSMVSRNRLSSQFMYNVIFQKALQRAYPVDM